MRGGTAKEIHYRKGSGGLPVARVRCTICGLQSRMKRDISDAIAQWNRRTEIAACLPTDSK